MPGHETIIISVGGSLIVPDRIDTNFLSKLKELIIRETDPAKGRRFIIICGGGKTARRYQEAATAVTTLSADALDWLGIYATRMNGQLVRAVFHKIAHTAIIKNPDEILDLPDTLPLIVAAGYRPGASTDLRAIQIADRVGAQKVINLSNIDHVYTADPKKDPAAKKIERISWSNFRKLIPAEWDPGLCAPFDPIAAREAQRLGIEVAIINGTKLTELDNYLADKPFMGTTIS